MCQSAPVGPIHRTLDIGHPGAGAITLTVNGTTRQSSDIAKLIWPVSKCIAYLSRYESLQPGDLIMTGTPEGVGAVIRGDVMRGAIAGLSEVVVRVADQPAQQRHLHQQGLKRIDQRTKIKESADE